MRTSQKASFQAVRTMEIVQADSNAMKIVNANDEASSYLVWKPWANTFLYYSFDWDVLDHSWNGRNWRVQQTITYDMSMWYKGASTWWYWLLPELWTMWTFTTSLWFRTTTTAWWNLLTIGSYWNWDNSNLDQNFSNWKLHIQIWKGSNSHEETFSNLTANDWKRHNLIVVKNWTSYSVYFDKTLISSFTDSTTIKWTANWSSYRTHPNFWSNNIYHWDLDEVIIETSVWSVEDVNSYYDKMKKYYSN